MTSNHRFYSLFSLKLVSLCVLSVCAAWAAIRTIHWPLAGDASIMHYIAFLIDRGQKPYVDIKDINLPGAWMTDYAVIHTLGAGPVAWRFFDLVLLGLAILSMVYVARPVSRFAGAFAGLLFALVHIQDGIYQIGQRDLVIAVLILLSCAAFCRSLRTSSPAAMIAFGLCAGLAASIKPTFLVFGPALLLLLLFHRRRLDLHFVLGLISWLAVPAAIGIWLGRIGAAGAFAGVVRGILSYHAHLARRPVAYLLLHSFSPLVVLVVLWLVLLPRQIKSWAAAEGGTLAIALAVGLMSYLVQGRGYSYHRYPFIALLLLMMAIDYARAISLAGFGRAVALAAIAFAVFVIAPVAALKAASYDWRNQEFVSLLQQDLEGLGGAALSGHIQCIDTIDGCYTALYNMRLESSPGFIYDEFLFAPRRSPVIAATQSDFWSAIGHRPPQVVVVTDKLFPEGPDNFEKLKLWPAFDDFLQRDYRVCGVGQPQRPVRWWSRSEPPNAFRLYCLVGDSTHPSR